MMKPWFFISLICLGATVHLGAQAGNAETTTLAELTNGLIKESLSERDQLDAIYQYVIHNISYDTYAYRGKQRRINRNSADVLRRKKAVCWGYSELIREMCNHAGIAAYTITGYSKELPFPARSLENANHAWNAVRLDGKWHLLDATWDSGLINGQDYFRTQYQQDYYLTPPELFIKNHLPIIPMWQLLECPVDITNWKVANVNVANGCNYNYNKAIKKFIKLSPIEQMAKEVEIAYEFNRTEKNKSLMGHGLVDIAFEKKERGDSLLESDQPFLAIENLEAALQLFNMADEYCEFYDWQEEGYVFTAVNLAQAYYQEWYEDQSKWDFIRQHFEATEDIINQSDIHPKVKEHTLTLIEGYIEVLN